MTYVIDQDAVYSAEFDNRGGEERSDDTAWSTG